MKAFLLTLMMILATACGEAQPDVVGMVDPQGAGAVTLEEYVGEDAAIILQAKSLAEDMGMAIPGLTVRIDNLLEADDKASVIIGYCVPSEIPQIVLQPSQMQSLSVQKLLLTIAHEYGHCSRALDHESSGLMSNTLSEEPTWIDSINQLSDFSSRHGLKLNLLPVIKASNADKTRRAGLVDIKVGEGEE